MRTAGLVLVAAAALVPCGGCGQAAGTPASVIPVKGKVMYQGAPVTHGTVSFEPEGPGREANGDIQPDGTFVLTTFSAGDGAIPGSHRVSVVGGTGKGTKNNLPKKYGSFGSSKLQAEVSADKTDYPLDLK